MSRPVPTAALIDRFASIVGPENALTSEADTLPYSTEHRARYGGKTALVLKPGSTEEVSAILATASETLTAIVPQGGNTGLVGGQVPDGSGSEVVLSLERMRAIRAIDPAGFTVTAEAGVILADLHAAAADVDRLFPLSLGAEGSCRIGGNISTNAGGTAVLSYGSMRDLVLGLEVVLADGRIWNGLSGLRKDNTGYDLKQLFIGAEGTLGVITAATLKLFPRPKGVAVALAGVESPEAALALFGAARERARQDLTSFELMPRIALDFVFRHIPGTRDPIGSTYPWYVLVEVSSGRSQDDADAMMEALLSDGYEAGLVLDAAVARSLAEGHDLWRIRHSISESQKPEGGSIKHDVSVAVADVPAFLAEATAAVLALVPDGRPVAFGHLGDGNIHFNISQPVGGDRDAFLARWSDMNDVVHAIVLRYRGSIAAEHGVGRAKRDLLPAVEGDVAMSMMRAMKAALDPKGILSPGRVL